MTERRGDVALDDPMKSLRKEVEYVRGGLGSEDENNVVIELVRPVTSEEMPVLLSDWYMPESILEVEFGEKGSRTESADLRDGGVE